MKTKRGTASKRLSLDLFLVNDYLKLFRERGSYFFAFLSIMTRSNLITILNNDMINVRKDDIIMIISYVVIRHHLRFQLLKEKCEGMRPFVMTTKDNHLPYTAVPCLNYTMKIYSLE